MSLDQGLLAVSIFLAISGFLVLCTHILLAHRARQHTEVMRALVEIDDQIKAINLTSGEDEAERAGFAERLEAEIAATRSDLEWLMGDRLIEMADKFVKGNSAAAVELEMPSEISRTIALFRQH